MIEKVSYAGRPNNYRLTDGRVEVIVTSDVGPRILRLGLVGGVNEFVELPDEVMATPYGDYRILGGHRLWHAPEAMPRSYLPDNAPVEVEAGDDHVELTQPVEPATGIVKSIRIAIGDGYFDVEHLLTNEGPWPVELAPWALSQMAPGGVAILRQAVARDPANLLPNRTLVSWPYTDLSDPRLTLGRDLVLLRQDPDAPHPIKVGINSDSGWAAYHNHGNLFVKRFSVDPISAYPDNGCTVESYTNASMLELETLGPLVLLEPGEATYHVERWFLLPDVSLPLDNEGALLEDIIGRLDSTSEPS
ncbi:MAG: hypothetical protein ACYC5O_18465 [Anaerolineae bacterium]